MSSLAIRGLGRMVIGGEERPFHLGTYQARVFCETRGVELGEYQAAVSELTGAGGLKDMVLLSDLLYSALAAGAEREGLPCDFTAKRVSFWLDEAEPDEIAKLFAVASTLAETGPAPGKTKGQPAKTNA